MGRALVVGNPACRSQPQQILQRLGFQCAELDDPYAATLELCKRPLAYRALILSLSSLFREELSLIATIKRRFPHVEIWLTHIDGRQASLAEAMRLGADGLLADDGLHRTGAGAPVVPMPSAVKPSLDQTPPPAETVVAPRVDDTTTISEPVLTADELRALLQDQPSSPGDQP
jgi:hypothetical protein